MHCPECGTVAANGAAFCGACGNSLKSAAAPACRNCGQPGAADEAFCAGCGHRKAGGAVSQPAVQARPAVRVARKPSRLGPNSAFGVMVYLIGMAGCGMFAMNIAGDQPEYADKKWLVIAGAAFIGYVILTIWRNLFINAGALTRADGPAVAAAGEPDAGGGGIKWTGIIMVIITVAIGRAIKSGIKEDIRQSARPKAAVPAARPVPQRIVPTRSNRTRTRAGETARNRSFGQ